MNVLANIDIDTFKLLTWVLALGVGALLFYTSPHKRSWEIVAAALLGSLSAAATFLLANLGVAFYILSRPTDSRWTPEDVQVWQPTEVQIDVPFLRDIAGALNEVQYGVSGAIGDAVAVQNAVLASGYFLAMVVATIGVVLLLAIGTVLAFWWSRRMTNRERSRELSALQRKAQHAVDDLADIRTRLNLPPFDQLR